jgi:hypothetical protein
MLRLVFSNGGTYVFLVGVVLLVVSQALGRTGPTPGPSPEVERRFSWKWVKPVPGELRPLMREAARERSALHDLLVSCAADYAARVSEGIKRIRQEV